MTSDRERLVRERAYALWESEGSPAGRERAHWEQASREIDEATGTAAKPGTAAAEPSAKTSETRPANPRATDKAAAKGASTKAPGKAPVTATQTKTATRGKRTRD